jgi:hypothetical protein
MADENARRNQEDDQEKSRAMGAGASGNYQGQPEQQSQRQPNETAGQGGGIQGTGQHQSNPGGFTGGHGEQRDKGLGDTKTSEEMKDRE